MAGKGQPSLHPHALGCRVDFDKDCEDPEYKPLPGTTKEQDDEVSRAWGTPPPTTHTQLLGPHALSPPLAVSPPAALGHSPHAHETPSISVVPVALPMG